MPRFNFSKRVNSDGLFCWFGFFRVNWVGMLDAGLYSGFEIDGALVQMIFELIFAFGISLETNENEIRKNI